MSSATAPAGPGNAACPPFHAEHVGSLLRPAPLRQAFRSFEAGELSDADFRAAQDRAITEAVRMQESIGLQAVTDGEFRRASYWSHFVDAVEGLTVKPAVYRFHDDAGTEEIFLSPHVCGKVCWRGPISGAEFDFLHGITARTAKITLPSPPTMHFWRGAEGIEPAAYRDRDTFFADLAAVYRAEIADLSRRGARYVQLDEVPLAMLCDPQVRARVGAAGDDPQRLVGDYITLINEALRDRPATLTAAMHLCRGNFKGRWLAEGGYAYVAERLFAEVAVDGWFLEYDTPRAGDFEPLAAIPGGRRVVLGLVSSKCPRLEDEDQLVERIERASRHLPLEQLALSPQCGFASAVSGNPVTPADQVAKLELVARVAARVWGTAP